MMKKKPEILFEWLVPQEIREYQAKIKLQRWFRIIPITLVAGIVLEVCLLIPIIMILKKCGPEYSKIPPDLLRIFIVAIPAMMIIPIIAVIWEQISLRCPPKWTGEYYQITEKYLIKKSNEAKPIKWDNAMFIGVSPHSKLTEYFHLNIFHNKIKKRILLPKSDLAEEIIEFVSSHCKIEKDDIVLSPIRLTPKQKVSIYCTIGLFILISTGLFYCMRFFTNSKDIFAIIFLIWMYGSLLFGPGTLSLMLFYRSLYFRRHDLRIIALKYNSISFFSNLAAILIYLLAGNLIKIFRSFQ